MVRGGGSSQRSPSRSHSHSDGGLDSEVTLGLRSGVLVVALTLLAALTVFGLVRFWPTGDSAPSAIGSRVFAVPGVQLPIATVVTVLPPWPPTPDAALDAGPDGASDGAGAGQRRHLRRHHTVGGATVTAADPVAARAS